ncbi:MAG TPA: BamA/TamA family outer membrane protein [Steroidobacteraceae bacterium]
MKHSTAGLFLRCASACCWVALSAGLAPPSWSDDAFDGLVAGSGNAYLAQLEAVPPPAAPPLAPPPPGQAGPKEPGPPAKPDEAKPGEPKRWYTPITRWLDPKTAPFLPVPEIAVDPDSGTTLGLIPTILVTDENDDIRKIIAPDLIHNPYFGWGVHGRIYSYDSQDEQWSIVTGIQERVEREFDGEYQIGRQRQDRWSFNGSLIYAVDGTPRFYGIGNESPAIHQTDYTAQSELLQLQPGYNLSHAWQIQYTARFQNVDVLPGTLANIATIGSRFTKVLGEGTNRNFLNRVSIVFDTRDDIIIPTKGAQLVAYGGMASRDGAFNDSLYTETGFDGRAFVPLQEAKAVIAMHMALRYLPTAHDVPFWALSSIGGPDTVIGGAQPLRGFGDARFYDRDSFSSSVEFRRNMVTFHAVATSVELELAPFIDVGRVFNRSSTLPFDQLHKVYGMGFRGIARPYVVGFVDIGYGSEGAAVFTGINYPF